MGSKNPEESEPPNGPTGWWYRDRQRKVSINRAAVEGFLMALDGELTHGREVAVLVASDAAVRDANRRYRDVRGSTDVLSFPDGEDGRLGDILISAHRAEQQAREAGHPVEEEVKILILHGTLHLLGWDHETDRGEMRAEEQRLRRKLGLSAGLIERVQPC